MIETAQRCAACGIVGVVLISLSAIGGCGPKGLPQIPSPDVDVDVAAAEAMRQYDKNTDGRLDEAELKACAVFASLQKSFDADGDGQIGEQEIADHLQRLFAAEAGLINVSCLVTHDGKPIAEATVEFIPEPFLGDAFQRASTITDSSGLGSLGIAPDTLPEELRSLRMMQAGLYRVEIRHPSLAGGHRPLGFEVDPTRRDGTTARFDL